MLFWGKAQPLDIRGVPWHPIAWHSLDVAAVTSILLDQMPWLVALLAAPTGADETTARRFIVRLAALHDLGKFAFGFQVKVPQCFPALAGKPVSARLGDHTAIGCTLLLRSDFTSLWEVLAPRLGDYARREVAIAVAGHHGRPTAPIEPCNEDEIGRKAIACALEYAQAALEVIGGDAYVGELNQAAAKRVSWAIAGVINLADWIGSNQQFFHYETPDVEIDNYWEDIAQPRARAAVAAAGLQLTPASLNSGFAALTGRREQPSPLQAHMQGCVLPDGGAFYLVEDLTGAGKTEAALILAHRLLQEGRADGIFVALPTQATANAMYARLGPIYRRLFAEEAKPSLALAHGSAALHEGFQESILDVGRPEVSYGGNVDDDVTASASCAGWIGSDRRRSVFAEVGVGTIDQAFLSVLPVKFAALRMLGLARKVLILDEIHAYGAYEGEELARLVEFHSGRGGSVIALSATLPARVKDRLVNAWRLGRGLRGAAVPWMPNYPLFSTIDREGAATQAPLAPRMGLPRTVEVERLATVEAAIEAIAAAVDRGACVALIRNTVDDVLAAHAALRERGLEAIVFHARFAMCDRQKIETDVVARFGPASTVEDRRGRVIVASQVIEQSIDVDFDVMISDLAPIDLLIQRAGRLWRHGGRARAVTSPRLLVISPEPKDEVAADWLSSSLRGTSYVYGNHALMWQTAKVLFAHGKIVSPESVRPMVEAVYALDALDRAPKALERSRLDAEGKAAGEKSFAGMNLLKFREGYAQEAAWNPEIHTPTRTGEERTIFRLARWDGASLQPWAGDIDASMTPREVEHLWAQSEVAVRKSRATGRGTYAADIDRAAGRLERAWGEMAGCVVLPLVGLVSSGTFEGSAIKRTASVSVSCDPVFGLVFKDVVNQG